MKTKTLSSKAFAKINLELEVIGRRDDGYHNISTIFQSISLADIITLKISDGNCISIKTDGAIIDGENLATKAAKLFLDKTNITARVDITLKKQIPLSAGLAGGSADAAAVLLLLNTAFNEPLSTKELLNMALTLGADVPFCLLGGTYLANGIGEKLTQQNYIGDYDVVLIKHHKKGSTGEMYSKIDTLNIPHLSDSDSLIPHISSGLHKLSPTLSHNSFLYASDDQKEQEDICKLLLEKGAFLSGLSGSGPTVFGLFQALPNGLIDSLKEIYKEVYICKTSPVGIKIIE